MMRMVAVVVLGWLAGVAAAAEIYKWVDEHGQTQYSNSVPKAQRSKAKPIELDPEVSDAQRQEAEQRLIKDRALAESLTRERQNAAAKGAPKATVPPPAPAKTAAAPAAPLDKKKMCEEEWKRYRDSQACFGPYRTANGGIKAEAFQQCADVKQPAYCD